MPLTIEAKIKISFNESDCSIPHSVLAQSIFELYSGLIMSWFTRFKSTDIIEFATNIHRMTGALISEATG